MQNRAAPAFIAILALTVLFSGCIDRPAVWGGPGDAKTDFLGPSYSKIVIEVDYESSTAPDQSALDLLKNRISSICKKEVQIELSDSFGDDISSYPLGAIYGIQEANRDHSNQFIRIGEDVFYAYVLYLDGTYSEGSGIIGLTYSADSYTIFQQNIKNNVSPFGFHPTASEVERSVLIHEFGHILGLVSRGQDASYAYKEDASNDAHCENDGCVMYYAVDTNAFSAFINNKIVPPTTFCESCQQEMEKYR